LTAFFVAALATRTPPTVDTTAQRRYERQTHTKRRLKKRIKVARNAADPSATNSPQFAGKTTFR
jgi:hypothetical protein